ncbi:hypothetical protein FDP22_04910 [Paroceanicella profunda]|uniref:Uncharacterized protein n=1 Tax=Paroceanicella profunda TaxID=2579971 RepID=A0A5B8FGR2_9RHOB|nr:hypothetical protein [Paroceanicella profunda]QDL91178.1 hypothetical protein FDP22_04910 [Paroceanicella profunda]
MSSYYAPAGDCPRHGPYDDGVCAACEAEKAARSAAKSAARPAAGPAAKPTPRARAEDTRRGGPTLGSFVVLGLLAFGLVLWFS